MLMQWRPRRTGGPESRRWYADQHTDPVLSRHADPLFERAQRRRRDQDTVAPPSVAFFDRRCRIADLGIDDGVRAQLFRERQLSIIDVDRADFEAHVLCILDGEVPQAADPRHRQPFAGFGFGLFDAL